MTPTRYFTTVIFTHCDQTNHHWSVSKAPSIHTYFECGTVHVPDPVEHAVPEPLLEEVASEAARVLGLGGGLLRNLDRDAVQDLGERRPGGSVAAAVQLPCPYMRTLLGWQRSPPLWPKFHSRECPSEKCSRKTRPGLCIHTSPHTP